MTTVKLPDKRIVLAIEFNGRIVPMMFTNFRAALNKRDSLDPRRTTLIVSSKSPYYIVNVKETHK